MALCELHYYSEALERQTGAHVLLPEGKGPGPFPVFYLLHGLSDDYTMWTRRSNIERYVQGLPLIVVMPEGGRSFYCDEVDGHAYQTALVRDLIPYIDTVFSTKAEKAGRCIGGLSMGGYGAIKLALQYPELFVSVTSHSGALGFAHGPGYRADLPETWRILGKKKVDGGGPNDLHLLATKADRSKWPHLLFDCGTEDYQLEWNRSFRAILKKLKLPHTYKEFPGSHDWDYWDRHIQDAVPFHANHLGIKAQ